MGAQGIAAGGIGAAQLITAKQEADAIAQQSRFEAQSLEFQSEIVQIQKREILKKSQEDIGFRQQSTSRLLGNQKVNLAAQGIEIDSGTSLEIMEQTREAGARDVMTISNNAWRKGWGMDVESQTFRSEAEFAGLSGKAKARSTLATGGLAAAKTGLGGFKRG